MRGREDRWLLSPEGERAGVLWIHGHQASNSWNLTQVFGNATGVDDFGRRGAARRPPGKTWTGKGVAGGKEWASQAGRMRP